jgi:hypothetical protein
MQTCIHRHTHTHTQTSTLPHTIPQSRYLQNTTNSKVAYTHSRSNTHKGHTHTSTHTKAHNTRRGSECRFTKDAANRTYGCNTEIVSAQCKSFASQGGNAMKLAPGATAVKASVLYFSNKDCTEPARFTIPLTSSCSVSPGGWPGAAKIGSQDPGMHVVCVCFFL